MRPADRHAVHGYQKWLAALLVICVCATLLLVAGGCATNTIATTRLGKVQGQVAANGVLAFKGIPYAQPPVGNLRFMPPQPASPWSGTRQATKFGKVEAQPPDALTGTAQFDMSEDCLTLNVWTPAVDKAKRPVMVWIHGGGFTNGAGSDPIYDGAVLAQSGNVDVVTLNYRLGPFGFLYLGGIGGAAYEQSGNLGLLDQVAALQWVRDNIASFGGDPGKVTVFGESAGSMSVCALLSMPSAKGLFRRAIAESGAANLVHSTANASAVTAGFMQQAGVTDLAGLQALTTNQMVQAEADLGRQKTTYELTFGPVVDGAAVPQPPLQAIAGGSAAGVDLLIGTNLNEMNLWAIAVPALARYSLSVVVPYVPIVQQAVALTALGTPDAVALDYRSRRAGDTPGQISLAVLTDSMFRVPAVRVAEAQSARQPNTWMYLFTWPSPSVPALGSCHAIELPFVFGNLKGGRMARLIGGNPPQGLSTTIQKAWTAFARTGNPNMAGVPAWQPYKAAGRATMVLNTTAKQQDDPYGPDLRVWNGVPFDGVDPAL